MKSRLFSNKFVVDAPLESVRAFHSDPGSMAEITPPGIRVQTERMPDAIADDEWMQFVLHIGPMRAPWKARFEAVGASGFTDRLLSGPFREWVHRHSFEQLTPTSTAVVDEIQAVFGSGAVNGFVSRAMWYGLPILFAFRAWKTRQILET